MASKLCCNSGIFFLSWRGLQQSCVLTPSSKKVKVGTWLEALFAKLPSSAGTVSFVVWLMACSPLVFIISLGQKSSPESVNFSACWVCHFSPKMISFIYIKLSVLWFSSLLTWKSASQGATHNNDGSLVWLSDGRYQSCLKPTIFFLDESEDVFCGYCTKHPFPS